MNTRICTFLAALCVTGALAGWAFAAQEQGDPFKNIVTWTQEKSRKDAADLEAVVRKASPAEYRQIEAKLIEALKSPEATADAKNFICRMLMVAGSAECVPAIAPLILNEETSNMARFALEPNASAEAGAALRDALGKTKGKLQIGVISSLGARRDNQAVDALARLTGDADEGVAWAAINALGRIGTTEAARALENARVADGLKEAVATARIDAARSLAEAGKTTEAIAIFRSLAQAEEFKAARLAANRGLMATLDKTEAVKLVVSCLQGDDAGLRSVALAAIQSPPEKSLRNAIAEQLPTLKADAQVALLTVLADQADVNLRPTLLSLIQDSRDGEVRVAAIEGMVLHGEPADVPMLVKLAAGQGGQAGPEAAAARRALERMQRPGVDDALIQLANANDSATRIAVVGVLSTRGTAAAMPALVKLMGATDATVAGEAVKAVSNLGTVAQLPDLVDIISQTNNDSLRTSAENASKSICARTTDKNSCAKVILPAYQKASNPAAKVALVRVLARVPNSQTLAAIRSAMKDNSSEVRDAATRELLDWTDPAASKYLLEIAKSGQSEKDRTLALRGYLRLAGTKTLPTRERLDMYRTALDVAKRPEEKRQAIAGLADIPSLDALDVVQKYFNDPQLGNDAAVAAIRLCRQLGALNSKKAMAVLDQVKASATTDDIRKQLNDAIKAVENAGQSDGYVVAWMVAGPYSQEGKDAGALLNIAFDPEKAGAKVEWRPLITAGDPDKPRQVDFNKTLGGGNNVVAYLKTTLTSTKDQEVLLEMGSDDGIKAWLNGKEIISKNVARPLNIGDEKVKVMLKKGNNTLLLKITQGGGDWGAGVRVRSAAGGNAEGVTVSVG